MPVSGIAALAYVCQARAQRSALVPAAGCALSLAVTNGTHTQAELEVLDNDGLLQSLRELPALLVPLL